VPALSLDRLVSPSSLAESKFLAATLVGPKILIRWFLPYEPRANALESLNGISHYVFICFISVCSDSTPAVRWAIFHRKSQQCPVSGHWIARIPSFEYFSHLFTWFTSNYVRSERPGPAPFHLKLLQDGQTIFSIVAVRFFLKEKNYRTLWWPSRGLVFRFTRDSTCRIEFFLPPVSPFRFAFIFICNEAYILFSIHLIYLRLPR
jgi:hypothetical protein